MSDSTKYPEIVVKLTGEDGNAFAVLGTMKQALRKGGHGDEVAEFYKQAMSGDYDHLLQVCMEWVTIR